ncbi:MAG TPA: histidine phosphatase family protein [Anaeromyxobacteraceae bacterium]|nr:histidine phosphatase family protein [Anaeromyxobacteraceae bacterium]
MSAFFYLVRHAEAARPEGVADRERPLSEEGRASFARLLSSLPVAFRPARVLASPYARALETAALLEASTGVRAEVEGALAAGHSTGKDILRLGRGAGAGALLVGHNPEMAEAVSLAAGAAQGLPPGSIAAVDDTGGAYRLLWVRSP